MAKKVPTLLDNLTMGCDTSCQLNLLTPKATCILFLVQWYSCSLFLSDGVSFYILILWSRSWAAALPSLLSEVMVIMRGQSGESHWERVSACCFALKNRGDLFMGKVRQSALLIGSRSNSVLTLAQEWPLTYSSWCMWDHDYIAYMYYVTCRYFHAHQKHNKRVYTFGDGI